MNVVTTSPGNDCWSTIGRPGPGTCPELTEHILCRNCPTYSAAALRLLDRPAPADYVREWTTHLAAAQPARTGGATISVLVFRVAAEWFALPVTNIEQVTEPSRVHALPHRTLPVRGVVSVRGELIVCVALEALLQTAARAPVAVAAAASSRRLVVIAVDGIRMAFEPDEVHGIERYDPRDAILAPATLQRSSGAHFTAAMFRCGGRTVGCLDTQALCAALARSLS